MTDTDQRQRELEPGAHDNDAGTLEVFPPARPLEMAAIGTLREHVGAMRDALFFAEGMCYTEMVPARFRGKPKEAAAAILFGAEVGLSPIASLRSVIVIHGQPGFEARTMKAILKAHGYRFRTIEKSPTRAEMWAWEPDSPIVLGRDPEDKQHYGKRILPDEEAVWTIDDAARAGYVPEPDGKGKGGWVLNANGKLKGNLKYIETPKVMLDAKVTAEVSRSIAPHLLLGLPYAAEELEDWDTDQDEPAPRRRPSPGGRRGVDRLRERARAAQVASAGAVDAEVVDDDPDAVDAEADVAVLGKQPVVDEPAGWLPDDEPDADCTLGAPASATSAADLFADAADAETAGGGLTPGKTGERAGERAADGGTGTGMPAPPPDPAATLAAEATPKAEVSADSKIPSASKKPPSESNDIPVELPMTKAVRERGERMLTDLMVEADPALKDDADRYAIVSEMLAQLFPGAWRELVGAAGLTNAELKAVVDELRAWKARGGDKLATYLGEALNAAALREAGLTEGG
jgi:hypothetical protein